MNAGFIKKVTVYVATALVVIAAAVPSFAAKKSSYCSPSGDYCTSALKRGGKVKLEVSSFSFSGRYNLCVTDPTSTKTCRMFGLRKRGELYRSSIDWSSRFPNAGPGAYSVSWQYGSTVLGPGLTFQVAAPSSLVAK